MALKIVKPNQNVERIRREIAAAEAVSCPRVPQVLEVGDTATEVGRCVWFFEEFVEGRPLDEILVDGPLDNINFTALADNIMQAIAAAEEVGIVHRDVKPKNIIRSSEGDYWLVDFGIARHLEMESVTPSAWPQGVGTLGYSAPEQMRNDKHQIDGRADLFAYGVVLHESSTGSNPFLDGAGSQDEIRRRVEELRLPPLTGPLDPEMLNPFVSCLTDKYRDRRPRTVAKAASWLEEILPAGA